MDRRLGRLSVGSASCSSCSGTSARSRSARRGRRRSAQCCRCEAVPAEECDTLSSLAFAAARTTQQGQPCSLQLAGVPRVGSVLADGERRVWCVADQLVGDGAAHLDAIPGKEGAGRGGGQRQRVNGLGGPHVYRRARAWSGRADKCTRRRPPRPRMQARLAFAPVVVASVVVLHKGELLIALRVGGPHVGNTCARAVRHVRARQ